MTRFQKLATLALTFVLILIFVGAIVRVTGAGLGCPDWPTCWGCIIPPWDASQVDLSKIDFEKFQKKAERLGRDPETVTPEHILESFNPRHVWTEFINRLFALPVGFFTLATFIAAFGQPRERRIVWWSSLASVLLVGINAVMGARVVYSGLKPGILTTHMALAMLLIVLLTFTAWRGRDQPWRLSIDSTVAKRVRIWVGLLFVLVVVEGIMGTQIREMTDALAKSHSGGDRSEWVGELEQSWVYLGHRSFSWAILVVSSIAYFTTQKGSSNQPGAAAKVTFAIVLTQMVLGLIMSQFHIYAAIQVLHVGLAGVLLSSTTLWFLGARSVRTPSRNPI